MSIEGRLFKEKIPMKKMIRACIKKVLRFPLRLGFLRATLRNAIFLKNNLAFPPMVQIEVTNSCNANCIMCPHDKMTRQIGNIDSALYKRLIDECTKYARYVKTVLPNHFGEPFLNPNLSDFISYTKKNLPKAEVCIFTNGSLINEANVRVVLESGLDILTVSFDGFSKCTYEGIRRNLDFDVVNKNIERLIELKEKKGLKKPRIEISYVEIDQNKQETDSFVKKWQDRVDKVNIGFFCNWGGAVSGEEVPRSGSSARKKRKPCTRLWSHMLVFRNGDVPLCCQDYDGQYLLGNVLKNSIQEIWQGDIINRYRKLHLEGRFDQMPICAVCNFWKQQTEPLWWW